MRRFYTEEPEAKGRHQVEGADDATLAALRAYRWPGNIRELRNVIFEALVHKRAGRELLLSDLPRRVLRGEAGRGGRRRGGAIDPAAIERLVGAGSFDLVNAVGELERAALVAALAKAGGNAAAAARLLGRIGHGNARDPGGTARAMMRRLGVEGPAAADRRPVSSSKRRRRSR